MRTVLLTALAATVATASSANGQDVPVYPTEAFFETTSFSLAGSPGAWSADGGSLLLSSDESGVFNVYRVDAKSGERTALTSSETNAAFAVGFMPDGEGFLYTADEGGDELNHLYLGSPEGEPTDLTPGGNLKASFAGWTGEQDAFFVTTNERDPQAFDLYRYDAESLERELVFTNEGGYGIAAISRDGSMAALTKDRSSADNDIFLVELGEGAEPRLVTEHEGNVAHQVYDFTPEGDGLVFGSDERREYTAAYTYDIASGETAPLIEAEWDVSYLFYSPSGRYRVHGVNADASTEVTVYDRERDREVRMPRGLPQGDLAQLRFSPDEKKLALMVAGSTSPSNLYVAPFGRRRASFDQLTDALGGKIEPEHLVEAEVIRFESYDGLEIPSIQYKPKGASAENPVPAAVLVHGGPGGQSRTGYSAMVQHMVNNGYAVLAVNNRGSSGYGKTFFHLDDQKHGDVDLKDIVASRGYLESLDWIDGENIAVVGGSYGGYMTMAALAFEPEAFDAGINIFGVTNWVRTLESIPPWWGSFRDALYDEMGDPATDAERHRAISPLFHADKVTKPVLIVQGANDPRVLQVESDEMFEELRKNDVPVEYVLFDDEGHGFRKRENRIEASNAYVSFLDEYLK
ncbi:S9 family peptidase [Parvularcula maris]|uniref:S9 family peptidase n=1 Tax=Parvularcula maris TaxID=2965077 RepID=A0A9X2LAW2_9PROT|nr:S9 family peptidase [Parvularcula maris]MCQ8185212.1 S9 family peptidase [Parvularcula maris]